MKIRFRFGLKFYITLGTVALFCILCALGVIPMYPRVCAIFSAAFVFVSLFEIKITNTSLFTVLIGLFTTLFSVVTGQYIVDMGFSKMSDATIIANIAVTAFVYFLLYLVFGRIKVSSCLGVSAFFILHFVNYALMIFRSRGLSVSDFYSVKIALTVAGNYKLTLTPHALYSLIGFIFVLYFLLTLKIDKSRKNRLGVRLGALGASAVCSLGLWWVSVNSVNYIQNWAMTGTLVNGATYNLIVELKESRVEAPEGYSPERVESILSRYKTGESDPDSPHIIVIMNEAFSDLSVLGEFETNIEVMPFFNSLSENTVRGFALSSVLGGNTATSEWEFLTGNSAAFIPYGAVAYQQYIHDHAFSIVSTLKDEGYTAVAMHPYNKSGWKRDGVYPVMGFDKMKFIDELSSDDKVRSLVSDRSFYLDIISEFEARDKGEKLFMFNITMQNHGGYTWGSSFPHTVDLEEIDYYDVEQYLTLVNMSDEAFRELVEYFEKEEERVMLVFFGDHQPSLSQGFYSDVIPDTTPDFDKVQKKQTVPFVIWTNYDIEEQDDILVGLNTLSSIVLDTAGIALPQYMAFLSDMREDIPAMNAYGYYSRLLERQARISEATGDEAVWFEEYRILQYNNLFDKKHRASAFD